MHNQICSWLILSVLAIAGCQSGSPPPTSTPTQPAAKLDPTGSYRSGGDCAHGSSENPTCTSQLELAPGGTGSFIGDDIVQDLTWTLEGDRVVVQLASRSFTLHPGPDGTLVDDAGVSWRPKAEPESE